MWVARYWDVIKSSTQLSVYPDEYSQEYSTIQIASKDIARPMDTEIHTGRTSQNNKHNEANKDKRPQTGFANVSERKIGHESENDHGIKSVPARESI